MAATALRPRAAVLTALVLGLLALLLAPVPTPSSGAEPGSTAATPVTTLASAPRVGASYRESRTLDRTFLDEDGQVVDANPQGEARMTVTARNLTELRGRERVRISWTGGIPSGGRAADPHGSEGLLQERPVVILQCRGVDDPRAPKRLQLRPETCWTSTWNQRTQWQVSDDKALWRADRYEPAADRGQLSGTEDLSRDDIAPGGACPVTTFQNTRVTPFVAADGTVYASCNATTMPPESADGAIPPAELAAFTDEEGNGEVDFEVRSNVENASLGCSDLVACSIVVIPIVGISCDRPSEELRTTDRNCRQYGNFPVGTDNYAKDAPDTAVAPELWWSESNWRNRFTIPIDFGLPPDACDIKDPRAPVLFNGSELMAQAALQWAPAYCLRKDRFKFQLSAMPDQAGWALMDTGGRPAAFVSSPYEQAGPDPIAFAPTAVTGFEIGYVIDRPDNQGEYVDLRLTPRLVAKLLTQSYPGGAKGALHPGMEDNPWGIQADPEFQALNPGLSVDGNESGATLASLSNASDIITQLTSWIARDRDAMAFMQGRKDPWGMRINPAYRGLDLPVSEWPLLDTWVAPSNEPCWQANRIPYFPLVAAPVTTLRKVADALIDAWPLSQTSCAAEDPNADPISYLIKRNVRQTYGSRFILGVVSLGDASRFGLRPAALQTRTDRFVQPTPRTMAAAVRAARQDGSMGPFTMTQEAIARRGGYPGTMIVHTAARTRNLDEETAGTVADFIRIATTEGQRPGRSNGQLPGGYLPIERTGVTAPLWRAAARAADAIEAQAGADDDADDDPDDADEAAPTDTTTEPTEDPTDDATDPGDDAPASEETVPTAATQSEGAGVGKVLLPLLIILGFLAAASSVTSWIIGSGRGTQP